MYIYVCMYRYIYTYLYISYRYYIVNTIYSIDTICIPFRLLEINHLHRHLVEIDLFFFNSYIPE